MIFAYKFLCSVAFGCCLISLAACGEGGEGSSAGAIASVAWDPVNDPTVVSYTVHYGKHSSGGVGSCNYEKSVDVAEPSTAIGGLEFNAQYYFAVSAFNGAHSSCSAEITENDTCWTVERESDVVDGEVEHTMSSTPQEPLRPARDSALATVRLFRTTQVYRTRPHGRRIEEVPI